VVTDRGDEHQADGVPDDGGSCVAIRLCKLHQRSLDIVAGAVGDGCEVPGGAAVRGVVHALEAAFGPDRIDEGTFKGLRNRGDDQLRIDGAPGKAGEAFADKTVVLFAEVLFQIDGFRDQGPGIAAVGGTKNSGAIVGVEDIVGVAGSGQDDTGAAGLDCESRC